MFSGMPRLMFARRHAEAPPVGLCEVKEFPAPSMATQNDTVWHETPVSPPRSPRFAWVQALAPPVGLVDVSSSPVEVAATQSWVDGQDTDTLRTTSGD